MPDFGSPVSGAIFAKQFGSSLIVPSTTANTKGAWADVGTINGRTGSISLSVNWNQSYTTHRTMLFDFAFGPAGSETTFLSNLACAFSSVGDAASRAHAGVISLPISLPAGSLIRARSQSSYASNAGGYVAVSASYNAPSPWVGSMVTTYGADLTTSAGVTLTAASADFTWGAYTQISASCERMDCFFVAVIPRAAQSSLTNQDGWWELAVGDAGSEKAIATGNVQANSATQICMPQWFGPFFQHVSAGQRLSARLMRQSTTAQRTLDIIVYGVS